jgi:hypothetical protein
MECYIQPTIQIPEVYATLKIFEFNAAIIGAIILAYVT